MAPTIKLVYAFSVSLRPSSANITIAENVTLTATVSGGLEPYIYKWYLNGAFAYCVSCPYSVFFPPSTGLHLIHVVVIDRTNATAQSNIVPIHVYAVPPNASFTYDPLYPFKDQMVLFNASSSTPDGGLIKSYEWDFGDGENASGKIVSHGYADVGIYNITLCITDCEDLTDCEQKRLVIYSSAPYSPVAFFTEHPTIPYVNDTVTFNAEGSTPGFDGINICPITEYIWDFEGDSTIDLVTSSPTAIYIYNDTGTYVVFLTVCAPTSSEGHPTYYPYDTTSEVKNVTAPSVGGEMILIKVHQLPLIGIFLTPVAFVIACVMIALIVSIVYVKHRKKQQV